MDATTTPAPPKFLDVLPTRGGKRVALEWMPHANLEALEMTTNATIKVPEWAKEIRVGRHGIIFSGGRQWADSKYTAGPFTIASYHRGDWCLYYKAKLHGRWTFKETRWLATWLFFRDLVAHIEHEDVSAILRSPCQDGDWMPFRVLADKLADLGHDDESALVRHYLPK